MESQEQVASSAPEQPRFSQCLDLIRQRTKGPVFETWFSKLELLGVDETVIRIGTLNQFVKRWIEEGELLPLLVELEPASIQDLEATLADGRRHLELLGQPGVWVRPGGRGPGTPRAYAAWPITWATWSARPSRRDAVSSWIDDRPTRHLSRA